MGLLQIAMIWGAASSALFSSPVQSGEWENFKDLKEALVRSRADRDFPLPVWAVKLDYPRPFHFYDVTPAQREKHAPSRPSDPATAVLDLGPRGNDTRPTELR